MAAGRCGYEEKGFGQIIMKKEKRCRYCNREKNLEQAIEMGIGVLLSMAQTK